MTSILFSLFYHLLQQRNARFQLCNGTLGIIFWFRIYGFSTFSSGTVQGQRRPISCKSRCRLKFQYDRKLFSYSASTSSTVLLAKSFTAEIHASRLLALACQFALSSRKTLYNIILAVIFVFPIFKIRMSNQDFGQIRSSKDDQGQCICLSR